ncbi:hypothetical protein MRY82_08615 [bacterium]|nr:hypothetical protein [bacterium]
MVIKSRLAKVFLISLYLFFATVYAQKNIRVVAFDDASIEKYGPVKVLLHLASAIKNVKSGDIVFDMNLWEPIDFEILLKDPNKREMVLDYKEAQKIFFHNVTSFCEQSLEQNKFFITAPGRVRFYEQASSMYLQSLKNLGLDQELPTCVEFAYAKGYEKQVMIDGDITNEIAIVKLKHTDLEHMFFAINRQVWGDAGVSSMLKGVDREIFLEYSFVDTSDYFDENYNPVNRVLALSSMENNEIIDSELTIFSAHSIKRDAFIRKIDKQGKIKQWYPGYFLIVLGIELVSEF